MVYIDEPDKIALFQAVDTHTDFIDVQNDYFETFGKTNLMIIVTKKQRKQKR